MIFDRAALLRGLDLRRRCGAALPFMEISELAKVLVALGCPAERSADMAVQLDKRAKQLAAEKNRGYEEALQHLLALMKQGWAAPKNL
jgi:hypothetical protein